MTIDIAALKKRRTQLKDKYADKLATAGKSSFSGNEDKNSWYPKLNEKGAARAVIRFLLPVGTMDLPWEEVYDHGFKGPTGKWYINNCPTSIGQDCPVCAANKVLWDTGLDEKKKIASERKRSLKFHANVLIVSDPTQPELNGTVAVFKFGPQVMGVLQDAGKEDELDPDYVPVDAFCPWDGANFVLKIMKDEKNRTSYLKSEFEKPAPMGTDKEIAALLEQAHDCKVLYKDESKFKSFDKLKIEFDRSQGATAQAASPTNTVAASTQGNTAAAKTGTSADAAAAAEDIDELDGLFEEDGEDDIPF
ncbi:MAG: hypothetical protein QM489_00360 [Candidatus Izemoplasma sp.]